MKSKSGRSQKIKYTYTTLYGLIAVLCIILATVIGILAVESGNYVKQPEVETSQDANTPPSEANPGNSEKNPSKNTLPVVNSSRPAASSAPASEDPFENSQSAPATGKEYVVCSNADITKINPLTVVDAEHPFDPKKAQSIVIVKTAELAEGGTRPSCYTWSTALNADAFIAFQKLQTAMNERFPDETGKFFIYIAYTSALVEYADATTDYNIGLSNARCKDQSCTDVSHSDHATGYSADIRYLKPNNEPLSAATKAEQTGYLSSAAARFGLMTSLEGGQVSWHIRYVGVPHALYMTQNGLNLAKYHEELKKTNYMKRLSVAGDNITYEMYYVKASSNDGTTRVPVPSGCDYQIWGNGSDGFIVTLMKPAD